MGKSSQRKGRGAELEIAEILRAAGWSAVAKPIYASMDVDWEGRDCEVKRRANGMKDAYAAFKAGARAFFHRSDRQQWLIVMTLDEYIRDHGPQLIKDE
jgi:hypothetical protein